MERSERGNMEKVERTTNKQTHKQTQKLRSEGRKGNHTHPQLKWKETPNSEKKERN